MRTLCLCTLLGLSVLFLAAQAALPSSLPSPPSFAEADGCKAYIAIAPIDDGVVRLLATPVVPHNPNATADNSFQELRQWDLPSKVIPWRDRPSAADLAHRWDELNKKWNAAAPADYRPYHWQPLPAEKSQELEKWFAKEGPKKVPGLCVDATRATYVLAIGIISGGGQSGAHGSSNPAEYEQMNVARQQDASVGPNAATQSPAAHTSRYDELVGMGSSDDPSAHTCTYLYRTLATPTGQNPARQPTPEYYYCKSGSTMPKSAVTTLLKYLSQNGLS